MLIKIYKLICCICFGLFFGVVLVASEKFKEKHPTATLHPAGAGRKLLGIIEGLALACCPILHVIVVYVLLFFSETIIDRTIEILETRIDKE